MIKSKLEPEGLIVKYFNDLTGVQRIEFLFISEGRYSKGKLKGKPKLTAEVSYMYNYDSIISTDIINDFLNKDLNIKKKKKYLALLPKKDAFILYNILNTYTVKK